MRGERVYGRWDLMLTMFRSRLLSSLFKAPSHRASRALFFQSLATNTNRPLRRSEGLPNSYSQLHSAGYQQTPFLENESRELSSEGVVTLKSLSITLGKGVGGSDTNNLVPRAFPPIF